MAASTAGAYRPEFPDPDRPLYTPDVGAQKQVVARIAQARDGKRTRKANKPEDAGTPHITITRNLPMGQHAYIGRDRLANALGCKHTKAEKLAAHPEKLDPWQVRQLCDLCGVTLDWLRGWEEVNAYGQYETADTVVVMYSYLSNEDRALVCDLLTRLLGANAVRAIRHEQWIKDNHEWLKRNPEKARKIRDAMCNAIQSLADSTALVATDSIREAMHDTVADLLRVAARDTSIINSIAEANKPAMRIATESIQEFGRAIKDRYTAEEWELIESTADELEAHGEDTSELTPDELLAIARVDSVKG